MTFKKTNLFFLLSYIIQFFLSFSIPLGETDLTKFLLLLCCSFISFSISIRYWWWIFFLQQARQLIQRKRKLHTVGNRQRNLIADAEGCLPEEFQKDDYIERLPEIIIREDHTWFILIWALGYKFRSGFICLSHISSAVSLKAHRVVFERKLHQTSQDAQYISV